MKSPSEWDQLHRWFDQGVVVVSSGLVLNQMGWLRGMFCPFPIFHIPCFSIGVLWSMIVFQIHDAWFLGLWLWWSSLGQYLSFIVLDTKRLGLLQILQYCLEIMAWFINPNFLIPNPPPLFGLVMMFQFVRWSFFCLGSWPHQNELMMESNFLQWSQGL